MTDGASQLIFESHKGQAQFAYFQLGVSASAIAFAIHETSGLSLADAPWPLGLAVLLWALSFAFGCFGLRARQGGLFSNATYLQLVRDIPAQPAGSEMAIALQEARDKVSADLDRPGKRFQWQMWTLFAGALAYISGHVMQMSAIPPKAPTNAPSEKK